MSANVESCRPLLGWLIHVTEPSILYYDTIPVVGRPRGLQGVSRVGFIRVLTTTPGIPRVRVNRELLNGGLGHVG